MSSAEAIADLTSRVIAMETADLPPGEACLMTYLRESQDFWEDEERDKIDPIWVEYMTEGDVLSASVAEIWGPPERVQLGPILDRCIEGQDIAPFPSELAMFAVYVDLWRRSDRFICLGVGHEDKELPVMLFVAAATHWLEPDQATAEQSAA